MGIIDTVLSGRDAKLKAEFDRRLKAERKKATKDVTDAIGNRLDTKIQQINKASSFFAKAGKTGVFRYALDQQIANNSISFKKKPGAHVTFDVLRRFANNYNIARACIDVRKRQMAGLDWNIGTADPSDKNNYEKDVQKAKDFFDNLGGPGSQGRYRKVVARIIEDLMVIDAVALYKQRFGSGDLAYLIPVDGSSIKLRVDKAGATPQPPEVAYKQIIRGQVVAELTTDDLYYDMMNPRTDSPYGLAPLESLVLVVSTALKGEMFNLAYLSESNVPEGFYRLPDDWSLDVIKDFQANFDAAVAGDEAALSSLHFMPGGQGTGYEATRKPTDMQFAEMNDWLMHVTCAMFQVRPREIGFLPKGGLGGKGFAEEDEKNAVRQAMRPLAEFLEEIWNDILENELGMPHLRFNYEGLEEPESLLDAQKKQLDVFTGRRSIDELRTDDGLEPWGLPQTMYPFVVATGFTALGDATSRASDAEIQGEINREEEPDSSDERVGVDTGIPADEPANRGTVPDVAEYTESKSADIMDELSELRKFRRMAIGRFRQGKPYRDFSSAMLPADVVDEANAKLHKAKGANEARQVFDDLYQEYNAGFVSKVQQFRKDITHVASAAGQRG